MSALANQFMGQTLGTMGAFVDARFHLERSLELCAANRETIRSYRRFGVDDEVSALSDAFQDALDPGLPGASRCSRGTSPGSCTKYGTCVYDRLCLGR